MNMAATQKNSDASSLSQEDKKKRKSIKSVLKNSNLNKKSVERDSTEIKTLPTIRKTNKYRTNSKNSQTDSNVKIHNNINIHTQKNKKSLIDKLRIFRHDAIEQHLFSTAAFWGEKIHSLTDDPSDIYWLAQIYFLLKQYPRVEHLLLKDKLVLKSLRCRILAVQCEIQLEKWQEALDILELDDSDVKEKKSVKIEKGIKLEATLYYLKGLIYSKQKQYDKAKDSLKKALQIDINCYEAYNLLISNYMLTNDEEWNLIQSLKFNDTIEGELIKLLYISKIKKYKYLDDINLALERLDKDFYLGSNSDIILSQANKYYTQSKFKECLELTTRILENDKFNMDSILLHIVCLFELQKKNDLFYLSHQLIEYYPEHEISWYSVGCYYLLIGQSSEARRYFSKSSTICSSFGSAWIGFAHSFAAESEHDQAILAYSTAAKLFQGIHLPAMFIGMQHLQINNIQLAEGFLTVAYSICDSDPTLLNELGVLYYNKKEYNKAITYFEKALEYVNSIQSRLNSWEVTLCNLGHAYRKIRNYNKAKEQFEKVFSINPSNSQAYSAMAFIHQIEGNLDEAIYNYHSALVLNPEDSFCAEMLKRALEELPNISMSKGVGFKFLSDDIKMEMKLNDDVDERCALPEYELLNELGFSYLLDNCEDEDEISNIEFNINSNYQNNEDDTKDVSMEICSYDSNNEDSNIKDDNNGSSLIKESKDTIFDKSPVNINYFMSKDYKFPDPDITPTINPMNNKLEKSSTNPFINYSDYSIYTPLQNANNSSILSDTTPTPTYSSLKSKQLPKDSSKDTINEYSMETKNRLSPPMKAAKMKGNNLITRFNNTDSLNGITTGKLNGRFGASTSFIGKDTSFNEDHSVDDESPLYQKNILDTMTPSKQKITNLVFSSASSNSSKEESSLKTPIPQQFLESFATSKDKYSSTTMGMLTKDKEKSTYIFNQNYLKDYYFFLKMGNGGREDFPYSSPDINDPNNSTSTIKLSSPLRSEIKPYSLSKDDSLSDIILTSPSNHHIISDIINRRRTSLPEDNIESKSSSNNPSLEKPASSGIASTSTSVSSIIRSLIKNRRHSRGEADNVDNNKIKSLTIDSSKNDLNTNSDRTKDDQSSNTGDTNVGSSSHKVKTKSVLQQDLLSCFATTYEKNKKKSTEEESNNKGKSKNIHFDTANAPSSYDPSEQNNKMTDEGLYNEPKRLKLNSFKKEVFNPFLIQTKHSPTSPPIVGITPNTTNDIPSDLLQQSPNLIFKSKTTSTSELNNNLDSNNISNISSFSNNLTEMKFSSPFVSEVNSIRRNSFSSSVDLLSSPVLNKQDDEDYLEVTPKPSQSSNKSTVSSYQQQQQQQQQPLISKESQKSKETNLSPSLVTSTPKSGDSDPKQVTTFKQKNLFELKVSSKSTSNASAKFSPTGIPPSTAVLPESRTVIINSSPKNGMIPSHDKAEVDEEHNEEDYFYQNPEQEHSTDDEDIDMEMD